MPIRLAHVPFRLKSHCEATGVHINTWESPKATVQTAVMAIATWQAIFSGRDATARRRNRSRLILVAPRPIM